MPRAQTPNQSAAIRLAQRRRGEGDVAQGLGQDAPQPQHDAGSELGIAHQPRNQLAMAADHLSHQKSGVGFF